MDRVDASGSDLDLNLDIDLESGGTNEEDERKGRVLSGEISEDFMDGTRCGYLGEEAPCGSTSSNVCSCSDEKLLNSDDLSFKNQEMQFGKLKEEKTNFVDKMTDSNNSKKQSSAKPPRPPRGPSLDASDVKLLKEISEINLKHKRIERIRILKKMKKEKGSSLTSNLFALLVTVLFLLVIFLHGRNSMMIEA